MISRRFVTLIVVHSQLTATASQSPERVLDVVLLPLRAVPLAVLALRARAAVAVRRAEVQRQLLVGVSGHPSLGLLAQRRRLGRGSSAGSSTPFTAVAVAVVVAMAGVRPVVVAAAAAAAL
jgi:hypothetical protein